MPKQKPTCGSTIDLADDRTLTCTAPLDDDGRHDGNHTDGDAEWANQARQPTD